MRDTESIDDDGMGYKSRARKGQKGHRVLRLSRALDFAFWKQPEALKSWQERASKALARASQPCTFGLQDGEDPPDLSTENCRAPSEKDLVEEMISRRQGLEMEVSLDEAPRDDEERVTRRPRKRLRRVPSEEAPIRSVAQVHQERAQAGRTKSSQLTSLYRSSMDFVIANRAVHFYVYNNCVRPQPHRWWSNKIAARFGGCSEPQFGPCLDEDLDCGPVDLSAVPEGVPRVDPNDCIVTVVVCNTFGHIEQEYDVLGSQRLYELRDAFHFASDWMFDGPFRLKSAMFFIDGVFYADKRDPNALDYSLEVTAWIQEQMEPGFLKKSESESMDVRLCDLERIPFGQRCVYVHQGDIEHNIFFTNVRLLNPNEDCPLVEAYPVLTYMRRFPKRKCFACWQHAAVWLVLDSSRCPHNPSFWCAECHRHFFLDADGNPVPPVDYKVFPYLHDEI